MPNTRNDQVQLASRRAAVDTGASGQTRRAYDLLRSIIRSGLVVSDQKLVEDRLISSFGVSRASVREALQQLAAEGLVTRQRRSGTRVIDDYYNVPVDDILPWNASLDFRVERTDYRHVPSTPMIRARLGITDRQVGLIEHVFSSGDEPIGVRTAYFRKEVEHPVEWAQAPSLAEAFESVFGSPLTELRTTIDAVAADGKTAALLGIQLGAPVLVREQLLIDGNGVPQEHTYAHYRADRVSFPLEHRPTLGEIIDQFAD